MAHSENSKTRADVLIEFLEVAIHSILYFRNLYPKSVFCLKKKYQIPIHVSMQPEVNTYITECLKTARELLREDAVKKIALVIYKDEENILEKHCFDIENKTLEGNDEYFVRSEEIFRQYLLKLSVADFKELSDDSTFEIQITTNEGTSVRLNENIEQAHFPWIEAEKKSEGESNFRIFPIKSLETSLMNVNMYVER